MQKRVTLLLLALQGSVTNGAARLGDAHLIIEVILTAHVETLKLIHTSHITAGQIMTLLIFS